MLLFSVAIILGLLFLVWSADKFVEGAVATALNLGMTPLMVGLTVIAFGTSAPELVVSTTAALEDKGGLAVGNAIGSNIANVGLVLGLTALVSAIPVKPNILRLELPVLLIATGLASIFLLDAELDFTDGVALLAILLGSMLALAKLQTKSADDFEELETDEETSTGKALVTLVISIGVLIASSQALVWGASGVARELGVSELMIGLTIVAIGTSLPELAASIASALKGHHDLALGNVIGSNLFNLLAVMALPAMIQPPEIDATNFYQDYGTMVGFTVAIALLAYLAKFKRVPSIGKAPGAVLFASYLAYLGYLIYQAL